MESNLSKYCRIANTPIDSFAQAKYSSFSPCGKLMSSAFIGWGCKDLTHKVIYKPPTFAKQLNTRSTTTLNKTKDLNLIPTTPPDCLDSKRMTYKETMNEIDKFKYNQYHKIGKLLKLPDNLPFNQLDKYNQRRLIKSLSRFEIVRSSRNKVSKTKKRNSKDMIMTANSPIQFAPILNKEAGDSSSMKGMMAQIRKIKNSDIPRDNSISNSQIDQQTTQSKSKNSLQHKFFMSLVKEGCKQLEKKMHYKGKVSARDNKPSKCYEKCCHCCKFNTKFRLATLD